MSLQHISAFVLAIVLVLGIGYALTRPAPEMHSGIDISKATLAEVQKLTDRTIVDFGYNDDGTVSYSYLAEAVPEKLSPNEVSELRTENSFTSFEGVVKEGTDPVVQLNSVFYSQPAFAQDVDGTWRGLEYATTTQQAFRERSQTIWQRIAEVFVRTAYADTTSPFSEAGDGFISMSSSCSGAPIEFDPCPCDSMGDVQNATAGSSNDDSNPTFQVYIVDENYYDVNNFSQCNTTYRRAFVPFTTSAIPSGSTITAATLNIWIFGKSAQINDGHDYVSVVQTSQGTHTVLENTDYDQCGGLTPTEGIDAGERKDLTSISTGAYLTFTLNSTGRGWIKKSGESSACSATAGITCLGLREGHDIDQWPGSVGQTNYVQPYASEQTGTANDPYLSVTYTVAASTVSKAGGKVAPGGSLKVVGGKLKFL